MNFSPAWSVGSELPALVNEHDRIGARRNMDVRSLLHARRAGELHVAICGRINRVVGTPDGACRLTGVWIRPLADNADVAIGYGPLQTLILPFAQVHRQLVRLQTKPRIQ